MITPRNGGHNLIAESESLRDELLRLSGRLETWAQELKTEARQLREEAGEGADDDGEEAGPGGPPDPDGPGTE